VKRVTRAMLAALLCSLLPPLLVHAQSGREVLFNGVVDGRRVVAFSVRGDYEIGALIDEMGAFAGPNNTVLAYADREDVSETEPLVVYVDGENVFFAEQPRQSSEAPTFADTLQDATIVERGERNGAVCRDGSQTDVTHSGACSFSGGVESWLYEAYSTTDAQQVVAAICTDHRLVAGDGNRCGNAGVLTQVMARLYPTYEPPDPSAIEPEPELPPTERLVAPLPEPKLAAPGVDDSRVEWTERSGGRVGFAWTAALTNSNDQPVRAMVSVNLRDAADEIIHTDQRIVALGAGARTEFDNEGTVDEDVALQGRRWTFAVELTDEDLPLTAAELGTVELVVEPTTEEARITNTGGTELDLNGWTLTSTVGGESFTFRFFRLSPGQTVVLTSGEGARSMLPRIYLWTSAEIWDDSGDAAELRDAQGRLRARTNDDGSAAALPSGGGRRASR